jgi:hypothetical protein
MKTKLLYVISILLLAFLFVSSIQAQKKKYIAKNNSKKKVAAKTITPGPIDPAVIAALIGDWKNQLGSTLKIMSIDANTGQLTGKYKSPSGTSGDEFSAIGWINTATPVTGGNNVVVVSFSVRWANATVNYGSVTAWNGYYAAGSNPKIVGQWLLSRANSSFEWDHILAGQDTFSRVTP